MPEVCPVSIIVNCENGSTGSGPFSRPEGVLGDGVNDDTAALQAALDAGPVYLPNGRYELTSTLYVPANGIFIGQSREECILVATSGIVGPIVSAPEFDDRQIISGFKIGGIADVGLSLRNNVTVKISDIRLSGTFKDGFKFERTWGSSFSDLFTFGSVIEGSCFLFGENFNANVVSNIYTGNECENNVLIENLASSSGHGSVFNGVTCQRGDVGLNIRGWRGGGLTINGLYTEHTGFPVVLGGDEPVFALTINGAFLNGPDPDHRLFAQRGAHIQINKAHDVTITSAMLDSYRETGAGSDEFLDGVYYHTCSNITLQGLATKRPEHIEEWKILKRLPGALTNSSIHILSSGPYDHSFLYMKARSAPDVSYVMHLNQNGGWVAQSHTPEIGTFPPTLLTG